MFFASLELQSFYDILNFIALGSEVVFFYLCLEQKDIHIVRLHLKFAVLSRAMRV